jgi:uncharacterized membrane protein YjgN (DUF898 family)
MFSTSLSQPAHMGSQDEAAHEQSFEFRGNAKDYFGIWIVNVLLSIVTFGIYSAWAKVRRLRYFYGHTFLAGHNFDYHADPKKILIGRGIAFAVLIIYQILIAIHPAFNLIIIPALFVLPELINRSIAFNARMTSHRNLRFGFTGTYRRALVVYLLLPLLVVITFGLTLPLLSRARWNYVAGNLHYGNARFAADPRLGPLYANLGASALVGLVTVMVGVGFFALIMALTDDDDLSIWHFVALMVYVGLLFGVVFHGAGVRNIALSSLRLTGGHSFISRLDRLRFLWIAVSNVVVTVATLGLMRPWAAIRSWRYVMASTAMVVAGSLDEFIGRAGEGGNVSASEFTDLQGIDFVS